MSKDSISNMDNIGNIEEISLSELLDLAIEMEASDVHISYGLYPFFRVYGELGPIDTFPKIDDFNMNIILNELFSEEQLLRFKEDRNIDSSYSYKSTRLRVHGYFQRDNMSLSLRLIPTKIPELKDLNLPKSVNKFIHLKNGLVLVTGITSSGKSTTLASMINEINRTYKKRILTIEDPIEYIHVNNKSMIEQREVGSDVKSFEDATRASLRADPDIILVGEIRDLETISNAITLAETGHLVLATLHTRSAAESPDRLIDVFPAEQQEQVRLQIANNLQGIISQQLVPSSKGKSVPLVEVLVANTAIRNTIKEGGGKSGIKDQMLTNPELGMVTKARCAGRLIRKDLADVDDLLPYLDEDEKIELSDILKRQKNR